MSEFVSIFSTFRVYSIIWEVGDINHVSIKNWIVFPYHEFKCNCSISDLSCTAYYLCAFAGALFIIRTSFGVNKKKQGCSNALPWSGCIYLFNIPSILTVFHIMLLTIIWLEIWDALAYCQSKTMFTMYHIFFYLHKANLRDLIAATGLVIPYWIQIVDFPACVTLTFDGWPRKVTGHFFYTMSSFVCASFQTHQWIQAKVTVRKRSIRFEIDILSLWPWNLKDDHGNNRALLLYYKLCGSFQSHEWIQTGVTVWKRSIRV